jgi:phosphonate transport system permease protein
MTKSVTQVLLSGSDTTEFEQRYQADKARSRRTGLIAAAVLCAIILVAAWMAEVDLFKFFGHIGNFTSYFNRLLTLDSGARVWTDFPEWFWGLKKWLLLLFDTLLMAFLGTFIGAIAAFFLSFLASANLVQNRLVRVTARRGLELLRTVPELVFALIFVASFGLGPLPGVLALMVHTIGALGKLFAEVIENIDLKPVEGLASTGASFVQICRFAVVPQVLSGFVSYTLFRFEVNVRAAGVIGLVGAGGIGQELIVAIRKFYYSDVSAILVIIIVAVMATDYLTSMLRNRFTSAGAHA